MWSASTSPSLPVLSHHPGSRQAEGPLQGWGFCHFSGLYGNLRAAEQQMLQHFTLVGSYIPAVNASWLRVSSQDFSVLLKVRFNGTIYRADNEQAVFPCQLLQVLRRELTCSRLIFSLLRVHGSRSHFSLSAAATAWCAWETQGCWGGMIAWERKFTSPDSWVKLRNHTALSEEHI